MIGFRSFPHRRLSGAHTAAPLLLAMGLMAVSVPAQAKDVPTCNALNLYGAAATSGLCRSLSSGTQNLWVCALTDANPDVHTTFNATTPFHITVRTPTCDKNSTLQGEWPKLSLAPKQESVICNVNVQNYIDRLNAVPPVTPTGTQTKCQAGFMAALNAGKISQAIADSYLKLCATQNPISSSKGKCD